MTHHSDEEIAAAFQAAPIILKELRELGLPRCSFRLFEDASGKLLVPSGIVISREVAGKVYALVYSSRVSMVPEEPGIDFCCGLVQAARERGMLS